MSLYLRAFVLGFLFFVLQTFARGLFAFRLKSVGNGTMAQKTFFLRGYTNYNQMVNHIGHSKRCPYNPLHIVEQGQG